MANDNSCAHASSSHEFEYVLPLERGLNGERLLVWIPRNILTKLDADPEQSRCADPEQGSFDARRSQRSRHSIKPHAGKQQARNRRDAGKPQENRGEDGVWGVRVSDLRTALVRQQILPYEVIMIGRQERSVLHKSQRDGGGARRRCGGTSGRRKANSRENGEKRTTARAREDRGTRAKPQKREPQKPSMTCDQVGATVGTHEVSLESASTAAPSSACLGSSVSASTVCVSNGAPLSSLNIGWGVCSQEDGERGEFTSRRGFFRCETGEREGETEFPCVPGVSLLPRAVLNTKGIDVKESIAAHLAAEAHAYAGGIGAPPGSPVGSRRGGKLSFDSVHEEPAHGGCLSSSAEPVAASENHAGGGGCETPGCGSHKGSSGAPLNAAGCTRSVVTAGVESDTEVDSSGSDFSEEEEEEDGELEWMGDAEFITLDCLRKIRAGDVCAHRSAGAKSVDESGDSGVDARDSIPADSVLNFLHVEDGPSPTSFFDVDHAEGGYEEDPLLRRNPDVGNSSRVDEGKSWSPRSESWIDAPMVYATSSCESQKPARKKPKLSDSPRSSLSILHSHGREEPPSSGSRLMPVLDPPPRVAAPRQRLPVAMSDSSDSPYSHYFPRDSRSVSPDARDQSRTFRGQSFPPRESFPPHFGNFAAGQVYPELYYGGERPERQTDEALRDIVEPDMSIHLIDEYPSDCESLHTSMPRRAKVSSKRSRGSDALDNLDTLDEPRGRDNPRRHMRVFRRAFEFRLCVRHIKQRFTMEIANDPSSVRDRHPRLVRCPRVSLPDSEEEGDASGRPGPGEAGLLEGVAIGLGLLEGVAGPQARGFRRIGSSNPGGGPGRAPRRSPSAERRESARAARGETAYEQRAARFMDTSRLLAPPLSQRMARDERLGEFVLYLFQAHDGEKVDLMCEFLAFFSLMNLSELGEADDLRFLIAWHRENLRLKGALLKAVVARLLGSSSQGPESRRGKADHSVQSPENSAAEFSAVKFRGVEVFSGGVSAPEFSPEELLRLRLSRPWPAHEVGRVVFRMLRLLPVRTFPRRSEVSKTESPSAPMNSTTFRCTTSTSDAPLIPCNRRFS